MDGQANKLTSSSGITRPRVALFVTCLVDLFRPSVAFAAIKLLEDAGCTVEVPAAQTCCGQPAYNSGDQKSAYKVAQSLPDLFAPYDYVVVPSGSCAGMLKHQGPELFAKDPLLQEKSKALAGKTWELTAFLSEVCGIKKIPARFPHKVTYHDSCSGLRELGIKQQPRSLLAGIEGLTLSEMEDAEVCCGFGGTFCVKYPDISDRMVGDKIARIVATGADTVLAGDLGCLLNIAGKLKRQGSAIEVRHIAEALVSAATPAIGESEVTPADE